MDEGQLVLPDKLEQRHLPFEKLLPQTTLKHLLAALHVEDDELVQLRGLVDDAKEAGSLREPEVAWVLQLGRQVGLHHAGLVLEDKHALGCGGEHVLVCPLRVDGLHPGHQRLGLHHEGALVAAVDLETFAGKPQQAVLGAAGVLPGGGQTVLLAQSEAVLVQHVVELARLVFVHRSPQKTARLLSSTFFPWLSPGELRVELGLLLEDVV